jgi:hypothetical protein
MPKEPDVSESKIEAAAYVAGWNACMAGEDGRYTCPEPRGNETAYAWNHGFLDAMEAEDSETPEPACAGYGPL